MDTFLLLLSLFLLCVLTIGVFVLSEIVQIDRRKDGVCLPVVLGSDKAEMPRYYSDGAAAADLVSTMNAVLWPGEGVLVGTDIYGEIPEGYVGLVCSRSGLAVKHGVIVLNAPGVIDSDYRGEWKVSLINLSNKKFQVECGMGVAQILIIPVQHVRFKQVDSLNMTVRGSGAFGHTG